MTTNTIGVYSICPHCDNAQIIDCDVDGLLDWHEGEHIQHALPDLTPADREALITGICRTCWTALFPELPEGAIA